MFLSTKFPFLSKLNVEFIIPFLFYRLNIPCGTVSEVVIFRLLIRLFFLGKIEKKNLLVRPNKVYLFLNSLLTRIEFEHCLHFYLMCIKGI